MLLNKSPSSRPGSELIAGQGVCLRRCHPHGIVSMTLGQPSIHHPWQRATQIIPVSFSRRQTHLHGQPPPACMVHTEL
ncbi:hypothetical protein B0I35DRAFT_209417 [Stachybotrys elegans]|uniref:Uncharacterized protein n=1 Tax=Stachybotrys elegans TaxID=80388 RepID=A0A8K0SSI5_9HYPO|nr:hypothetical protein B0I35DRAFT_209417 [Stachybotrys elegans]